jgi:hypothetical protein
MIRSLKDARTKKCPVLFSMKRGTLASGIPNEMIHNCVADDCQWWVFAEPGKGSCAAHALIDILFVIADRMPGD